MTIYGGGRPATPPPAVQPMPVPRRPGRGGLLLIGAALAVLLGAGSLGMALLAHRGGPATPALVADSPGSTPADAALPSAPAGGAADEIFTLSAVGDTIMAAAPNVPANNGHGFFDNVRAALASDLPMANLEEPITADTGVTKCGSGSSGCHAFRAPPACAGALKEAGFRLLNLANNHALDFGSAGHQQTMDTLTSLGLRYTGPPGMITVLQVKGVKVAVLGFAPYRWANSLTDLAAAKDLVRQARQQADLVIVQAHVGAEGSDKTHVKPGTEYFLGENRGDSIAFGHAVVDAGAALVIMHGPHVMRGMEFYKGHLIDYSMGNFAGYHALLTTGVLGISGILRVTMTKDGRFVAGRLVATSMVSPGVPRMDPAKRAIGQVRALTRADFPDTGAVLGADGGISPPAG